MPNAKWAALLRAELREAKLATRQLMGEVEHLRWERDEALARVKELENQHGAAYAIRNPESTD